MSRLTDLLAQVKKTDSQLGKDLEREFKVLASRRSFGLNFERHRPEAVELPQRPIRKGDKVRVLPERGSTKKGDQRLWFVKSIKKANKDAVATISLLFADEEETQDVSIADLVVVAEFQDYIYPGLVSTGTVERGGNKPFHTVINAENYHAVKALTYTHRGKIDAIYIDPPYNTGARDWKYNNDYVESEDLYRHSKWLAMMERRFLVAKELLNPHDSVLVVTIDEKEYLRLGLLLEQLFPESRIQMVSIAINPAAVARAAAFGRLDEYAFFVMFGDSAPSRLRLSRDWVSGKGRTHTGKIRWDLLRRSGTRTQRTDSPGCFYPIYIDPESFKIVSVGEALDSEISEAESIEGAVPLLPIRQDGSEGNWQWSPKLLRERLAEGRVKVGGNKSRGFTIYILKPGEFAKIQKGEYEIVGHGPNGDLEVMPSGEDDGLITTSPSTQWRVKSHDATQYGSRLLNKILPGTQFPFPKSLYAVEDSLRFFVSDKKNAVILDYFAGSGTTVHAVLRLNKQDGGCRQCISVTNNEVSANEEKKLIRQNSRKGDDNWEALGIFNHVTKPRLEAAITGKTPKGRKIVGDYKFTDEFPMSEGFEENAEFFALTYESPIPISHNLAFQKVAPLLWMRAGSQGRRIEDIPVNGWDVADTYGLLVDLDHAAAFCNAINQADAIRIAFIVTNDDRRFQAVAKQLPSAVEPVRLYESYLTNFQFTSGD